MQNVLKWLGLFGKFFGAAGAALSVTNGIPPKYLPYCIVIALVSSVLKDFVIHLGDLLDDGEKNNSFKIPVMLFLVAFLGLGAGTGCTSLAYTTTDKDGKQTVFKATGVLSNKTMTKIGVGGKTEKTEKGMTVGSVTDDVSGPLNSMRDLISAGVEAAVEGAVKGAAKTVKP